MAQAKLSTMTQAVGLATTIKGDMAMRADDPIGMMQEVVAYVGTLYEPASQPSCPTCARLRGLLRDVAQSANRMSGEYGHVLIPNAMLAAIQREAQS